MSNMKYINRKISGKSVLFEPVLLQVAQLGIYFYCFYCTPLRDLIKDTPLSMKIRKR